MKTTLTILALTAALTAGSAHAQRGGQAEGPVTKEEALAKADERFGRLDANGDGFISEEELEAAAEKREQRRRRRRGGGRMFDRLDTNDDGFLSRAEMQAQAEAHFDRIDADGDGVLSEEEREAAREHTRRPHEGRRGNG